MRELVHKFVTLERDISAQRGAFSLFALFLRDNAPNTWDVVAAAPWFGADDYDALDYIAKKVQSSLQKNELVSLSRIVLLDQDNPGLEAIHKTFSVEHGTAEFKYETFFGMDMRRGYIITSSIENATSSASTN